jgi:hypothetical protein
MAQPHAAPLDRQQEQRSPSRRPTSAARAHETGSGPAQLLALQGSIGNQAVLRLLGRAQMKLQVGPADDPYERQADMVAHRVMAAIRSGSGATESSAESALEEDTAAANLGISRIGIRRFAEVGAAGGDLDSGTESELKSQLGSGRPLPGGVRRTMESAFGASFDHVRVHDDSRAAGLNERVSARAFTIGSDIFLGRGSDAGNHELLAHELTHVVQQTGAR